MSDFVLLCRKAWGEGLSRGCAGQQSSFLVNPNGLNMSGVTFGVEGKTLHQAETLIIVQLTFIT